MKTVTVGELRACLTAAAEKGIPDSTPVCVWLPGSRLTLGSVFIKLADGQLGLEGNVVPGSALEFQVVTIPEQDRESIARLKKAWGKNTLPNPIDE